MDRRDFMRLSGALAGTTLASSALRETPSALAQDAAPPAAATKPAPQTPAARIGGNVAVVTPNGKSLTWKQVGGVKIGHLIAQVVDHEFVPGFKAECWGYNGGTPGPTLELVQGDRVRLYVTNRLPEATTVHLHGIRMPNGMDGVAGLTQRAIKPGETFKYELTFKDAGTFMYHPHFDEMTQMALGMVGMIVVHPKTPRGPRVDRDFVLMTHEWKIPIGTRRPDPMAMSDFNVLTFNSKAFPATEPLLVGRGERVRIRIGNLSAMDHHPIHLHGYAFKVTGTDGGLIPEAGQWPETSVLVPVGSTRTIEFVADALGDWAMHCHMTHHIMNQMGHESPIMIGADPKRINKRVRALVPGYMTMGQTGMGDMSAMHMPVPDNSIPMLGGKGPFGVIDMGGMFTVLKVRENPETADPNGYYVHPEGSVADVASATDLASDGVDPNAA